MKAQLQGGIMDREDLQVLADEVASRVGVDPEQVQIDFRNEQICVKAAHMNVLLGDVEE